MTRSPVSPLRKAWAGLLCFVCGILSAMSFVVSGKDYLGMSALPAAATDPLWSALALCFGLLFWAVYVRGQNRRNGLALAFGLLFGLLNAFGSVLFAYDSWSMSAAQLALTLLKALGQSLPMTAFFTWLHRWLLDGAAAKPGALENWNPARFPRLRAFVRRHELLSLMALFVLCWSPYLLAFYPGTVCWDLGEMVAQFFGEREMDTWHPVFLTWVLGGLVWFGRLFGNENLGAALYTLLQTLLLSYALARSVQTLRRLGLNRAFRLAVTAFFALTPLWGGYAQFISKDTLYTAALLLFSLSVLDLLLSKKASPRLTAALFAWGLLPCQMRSNGLYVVLPTALLAVILAGRARLRAGAALCGAVACALLFSGVLVPALGIRDETASGLYSVCFQQSARILRDHADTVTPEEYAEIDYVLDAEHLAKKYEPWISDPVKYTFRQYGQGAQAEKEALRRYRKTWLSMLKKYPLTCMEAFFAGNISYYTFQPQLEGKTYNQQAGTRLVFDTHELGQDPRFLHTRQKESLAPLRTVLATFAKEWRRIPLVGLLYACAAYTWTLVGVALSLIRRRRASLLAAFLPALMTLGVCMLGPVNDYFRYFLPIVAMTPHLLGLGCRAAHHSGPDGIS